MTDYNRPNRRGRKRRRHLLLALIVMVSSAVSFGSGALAAADADEDEAPLVLEAASKNPNGLARLRGVEGPLTRAKLEKAFPEYEVSIEERDVGEGMTEKKAVIKKGGKEALVISPGDNGRLVARIDVYASDLKNTLGAAPGEKFGEVLDKEKKVDCGSHAEAVLGPIRCTIKMGESRLTYTLREEEGDKKECVYGGYSCEYDAASLADNTIVGVHWELQRPGTGKAAPDTAAESAAAKKSRWVFPEPEDGGGVVGEPSFGFSMR